MPCTTADSAQAEILQGRLTVKELEYQKSITQKANQITEQIKIQLNNHVQENGRINQDLQVEKEKNSMLQADRELWKSKAKKRGWTIFYLAAVEVTTAVITVASILK